MLMLRGTLLAGNDWRLRANLGASFRTEPIVAKTMRLYSSASTTPRDNKLSQFLCKEYIYCKIYERKWLAVIWPTEAASQIEAYMFSIGKTEPVWIGRRSWIAELSLERTPTGRVLKINCRKTAWREEWDENIEEESGHSKRAKHLSSGTGSLGSPPSLPTDHHIKLAWVPITTGIKAMAQPPSLLETWWEVDLYAVDSTHNFVQFHCGIMLSSLHVLTVSCRFCSF